MVINESLFEKISKRDALIPLFESMFNVKDLDTIDNAFNGILNDCVVIKSEGRTNKDKEYKVLINKQMDDYLSVIEKTVKKIFNIDLKIKLDTKTKGLQYFACIYLTEEDMKQARSEIEEIIKDEKLGYHYIKIKKADILFQPDTFCYVKDFNGERNLNGRHLTAILLHEIGHKIFLRLAFDKTRENEYKLSINDGKPRTLKVKGANKEAKMSELASSVIVLIFMWVALRIVDLVARVTNTKEYSRIESYSDRMAIQYGLNFRSII